MRRRSRRGDFPLDVLSSAETWIEKSSFAQSIESGAVGSQALRLTHDWARPVEAEPCEILGDGLLELRATASLIDILYTQQEAPSLASGRGAEQG